MKNSAMDDCRSHKAKIGVAVAVLLSLCVSTSAHSFRAATVARTDERQPVTGMISSLFGGFMNVFQSEDSKTGSEVKVSGWRVRDCLGKMDRALSSGGSVPSSTTYEGIFINAGSSLKYTDTDGVVWITDKGLYNKGKSYTTSNDISNTDKPTIY